MARYENTTYHYVYVPVRNFSFVEARDQTTLRNYYVCPCCQCSLDGSEKKMCVRCRVIHRSDHLYSRWGDTICEDCFFNREL